MKACRWKIPVFVLLSLATVLIVLGISLTRDGDGRRWASLPWTVRKLSGSSKQILDRLDARIVGFGDYVAVETQTLVDEDGALDARQSSVQLYAQVGKKNLWCRYLVGDQFHPTSGRRRGAPVMSVPKGWPCPELQDLLHQAKTSVPSEYAVTDGKEFWSNVTKSPISLAEQIWWGRKLVRTFGRRPKLITDVNRPDLVGLYVQTSMLTCPTGRQKVEQVLWLDPNRDDGPVETLSRDYSPDGKTIEFECVTKCTDSLQLPDGRWYPHCRTITRNSRSKGKIVTYPEKAYLRIFPKMELDSTWFTDPNDRPQRNSY